MTDPKHVGTLAILAVVVGALIRAVKSDAVNGVLQSLGLPPVPKRALPWLALALGAAAGVIAGLQEGKAWAELLGPALEGLGAGVTAIAGHELVVESARNGKEMGVPKGGASVLLLVAAMAVAGCAFLRPALRTILTLAEEECAWRKPGLDVEAIRQACHILDVEGETIEKLLAAKRAAKRAGVYSPMPDAGAIDAGEWKDAYVDAGAEGVDR